MHGLYFPRQLDKKEPNQAGKPWTCLPLPPISVAVRVEGCCLRMQNFYLHVCLLVMYMPRVSTRLWRGLQQCGMTGSTDTSWVFRHKPIQFLDVRKGCKPVRVYAGVDISQGTTVLVNFTKAFLSEIILPYYLIIVNKFKVIQISRCDDTNA